MDDAFKQALALTEQAVKDQVATSDTPSEAPLVEQLRSIPNDYRTVRAIQWSEDGRETGHQFIPVGYMMHRAADQIEYLQRALAATLPKEPAVPEGMGRAFDQALAECTGSILSQYAADAIRKRANEIAAAPSGKEGK